MKRILFPVLICLSALLSAQDIRPVRDDVGFCWLRPQMERLMSLLDADPEARPASTGIVAAISPHDDYLYAGRVYYPLFKNLRAKEAVIFGVTHGAVRKEIGDPQGILILDGFAAWQGLGGTAAVSPLREKIMLGLAKDDFIVSNRAHSLEHSIEALLPWLQFANPGIRITPIMVTAMPFGRMEELSMRLAGILAAYIEENHLQPGRDIVFLISADANHYGRDFDNIPYGEDVQAHAQGASADRRIAAELVEGTLSDEKIAKLARELWGSTHIDPGNSYWCGKYDIPFGLLAILKTVRDTTGCDLRGELLVCSDTYSEGVLPMRRPGFGITAPFSPKHWVGFFSAAFRLQ